MIPLLHTLTGARVLVFGGGRVGARKSRRFAREAEVVVVSPTFVDEPFGGAERVRARPTADEINGWLERAAPAVVVTATDDAELNRAIETTARDHGVLINRADRGAGHVPGDVVVPATYRDEPVVVAVSTDATSPTLSRYLRQQIESEFAGAGAVAAAAAAAQEHLQHADVDADVRRTVLRRLVADDRIWTAARTGQAAASQVAQELLPEFLADANERTG